MAKAPFKFGPSETSSLNFGYLQTALLNFGNFKQG